MTAQHVFLSHFLRRLDEDVPSDARRELAHDLADRGREDVDAADDQHVVRASLIRDMRAVVRPQEHGLRSIDARSPAR